MGGGVLHLKSLGTFLVDGSILSNGNTANKAGNGGASGGSIWLEAADFQGALRLALFSRQSSIAFVMRLKS